MPTLPKNDIEHHEATLQNIVETCAYSPHWPPWFHDAEGMMEAFWEQPGRVQDRAKTLRDVFGSNLNFAAYLHVNTTFVNNLLAGRKPEDITAWADYMVGNRFTWAWCTHLALRVLTNKSYLRPEVMPKIGLRPEQRDELREVLLVAQSRPMEWTYPFLFDLCLACTCIDKDYVGGPFVVLT